MTERREPPGVGADPSNHCCERHRDRRGRGEQKSAPHSLEIRLGMHLLTYRPGVDACT